MRLDAGTTIYRFGHELNAWCLNSARVSQTSTLFDLAGRSTLGFALLYEVVPQFLRELDAAAPRERLGASLRQPLMRPGPVQALIVIESWLMGRERLIIDAGERLPDEIDPERDRADWELVGSWYSDVVGALRGDGAAFPTEAELYEPGGGLSPGETIFAQPVLDEKWLSKLQIDGPRLGPDEAERAQRALGMLDMFALTLHGEQRDGLFDRGPWRRENGWTVSLHEVNDLDNEVLPWSSAETRLGVDAVGAINARRPGSELPIDMWGTVAGGGLPDEIRGLWVRRDEELRPLGVEELEEIAARAGEACGVLYKRMADWDEDYRIAYGAPLFINHLVPLARAAGADRAEAELWAGAERVLPIELPRLRGAATHPVWARLARTDTDVVYTAPVDP